MVQELVGTRGSRCETRPAGFGLALRRLGADLVPLRRLGADLVCVRVARSATKCSTLHCLHRRRLLLLPCLVSDLYQLLSRIMQLIPRSHANEPQLRTWDLLRQNWTCDPRCASFDSSELGQPALGWPGQFPHFYGLFLQKLFLENSFFFRHLAHVRPFIRDLENSCALLLKPRYS